MKDCKNIEKLYLIIYGLLLTIIGAAYLLHEICNSLYGFNQVSCLSISGGAIVLLLSVSALFYVLKGNFTLSSSNKSHQNIYNTYTKEELKERYNTCNKHFSKAAEKGTTQYFLESVIKNLSGAPDYIRYSSILFFNQLLHSFAFIFFYTLHCIVCFFGITSFTKTPIGNLYGWLLVLYLLLSWLITFFDMKRIMREEKLNPCERVSNILIVPFVGAVILPHFIIHLNKIVSIPEFIYSPLLCLFMEVIIILTISAGFFTIVVKRVHGIKLHDNVSVRKSRFKMKLHPIKLFHYFEKYISKEGFKKNYKKIPLLKKEEKRFDGYLIYETDVTPLVRDQFSSVEKVLKVIIGAGYSIFFVGALSFLYFLFVNNYFTAAIFLLIICGFSGFFTYILTLLFGREQFYISHLLYISVRGYYDNDDNIAANDETFSTITDSTSYSVSSYLQLIRLKTSIHALGNKRYINHIEKDNDSFMEINDLFEECIIKKGHRECCLLNDNQVITDKKLLKKLAHNLENARNLTSSNKEKAIITS